MRGAELGSATARTHGSVPRIVYDVRGHGLSEAPYEVTAHSQQHMVEDLYGRMDNLPRPHTSWL